jgi:chemotaxis protein MotB
MARTRAAGEQHGDEGGHSGSGGLRWLLTYADMITLLMAFFIMLYSMSILSLNKFKEVAISIRSGFGGPLEGGTHLLTHPAGQRDISGVQFPGESKSVQEVAEELKQFIDEHALEGSMRVSIEPRGLVISIVTDNLLFPIGSSELRPQAREILDKIAEAIERFSNSILVEGHTCRLPIATSIFPSNWELSAARASRVVRYLVEQHAMKPSRFAAVGYADTRPVAPNNLEVQRRRNRRVDIVVLTTSPGSSNGQSPAKLDSEDLP